MVKQVINRLMKIYQDDKFSVWDVKHPPFRHSTEFSAVNVTKAVMYLQKIGEVEFIGKKNNYIVFRVTEKFGEIRYINMDIPVTEHIIKDFDDNLPKMMSAYGLFASFENKLRFFISSILEKKKGRDWWETSIPKQVKVNIRTHRHEEWHIQLPKSPIQYTTFTDLVRIINKNWDIFEPVFKNQRELQTYLDSLEIPRNTIAHSNVLSDSMYSELELTIQKIINLMEKYDR